MSGEGVTTGRTFASSRLDDSAWPVAIVRVPVASSDPEALDRFFGDVATVSRRCEKHVLVVDARGAPIPANAAGRDRIRRWMSDDELRTLAARYRVCDVVLTRSTLVRAASVAVHWIIAPPHPTHLFASMRESIPWVRDRCREADVAFTEAMAHALDRD